MQLAMYRTPSEVAADVKETFNVEVSRQLVHEYNPDGSGGPTVAQKWKDLHAATRKAFLEDTGAISVAQKAYRLNELADLYRKTKERGESELAAEILEQAAKEMGEAFTNRHRVGGDPENPLVYRNLSQDQLNERIAELVGKAGIGGAAGRATET